MILESTDCSNVENISLDLSLCFEIRTTRAESGNYTVTKNILGDFYSVKGELQ